jgi:molecular chaperone HscB
MDFSQNHFALFDLPATFALDRARLDSAYRALQNAVHPDRFAAEAEAGQRLALQWSSRVNEAYQTLRNPVTRGAYLLGLAGIDAFAPHDTRMAPAFLMQQMEWREAVDAARAQRDVAALGALEAELAAHARALETRLGQALDVEHDLDAATAAVRELRFMEKLLAEIGDVYEELEA